MIVDPAPFVSHSGMRLPFKIDCDAFSDDDIAALAQIAAEGFVRHARRDALSPWVYPIFQVPWWLDQKDGDAP